MSGEHHVACFIGDDGIGMHGSIVEELMDLCFGVLCQIGLLQCKRTESR